MLSKIKEQIPVEMDNVEEVKALYEAIDKLQDKLAERNPFSSLGESLSRISTLRSLLKGYSLSDSNKKVALSKETRNKIGINSKEVSVGELFDKLRESENRFISSVGAIGTAFKSLQDVMQPVIDIFDYLGDEDLSKFFSIGSDALGSAANAANGLNTIKGLFKDDSSIAKFLGGSSPYAAAAAAGLSIISSLFAMHDAALQKEIEASEHRQKLLEYLTNNIEKLLERTLGGAYNTKATTEMIKQLRREISADETPIIFGTYSKKKDYISNETQKAVRDAEKTKTYYDAVYASLLAQRDELQHQMQMEEDKKKTDQNAIDEYKQQLQEMDDEIKHFAEDLAKALYDIDVKSWASELGDALFEAWQKGESGAEAFKKKASEIMADISKNIAVAKLIETAMQPTLDAIVREMERTKGMLDQNSIEKIAKQMGIVGETLPDSFNALMDGINEGLKRAGLTDMKELANDTNSATQNGIGKAITEQDTSLWSSYLNGIRLDVSVIRATEALHLPAIALAVHGISVLAESQVTHLQNIAENTKRNADAADKIYNALHKIETGATKIVIK